MICGEDRGWGWGDNAGKCCKLQNGVNTNADCVNPTKYTTYTGPKDGEWMCPLGFSWGWDGNTGKCCLNNTQCRDPLQFGNDGCERLGMFLCENDVGRDGGLRNSSQQPANEFKGTGMCCKYTNRGCGGFLNAIRDAGMKGSGYYTADDGCNVDVFGFDGSPVATNGKSWLDTGLSLATEFIPYGKVVKVAGKIADKVL
jgi:hypothetical protein